LQDKVWVTDPDGARWEVYTVLGDSDVGTPAAAALAAGIDLVHAVQMQNTLKLRGAIP
jgi:hypothetical protein